MKKVSWTEMAGALTGWVNDLTFRTAARAVDAVRYQPRRFLLASGSRLADLPGAGGSRAMSRASSRLDGWMDDLSVQTGARFGAGAEAWFRWASGAVGGLLDSVGASAVEDFSARPPLRPSMLELHEHAVGVLVIDMRGFSRLTSQVRDTKDLTQRIEEYLSEITRVVERHHGVIFQYTGDGLLALFLSEITRKEGGGMVEEISGPLATDLQLAFAALHDRWRADWEEQGMAAPEIGLAAGATHGVGTIGLMGPPGRKYFGIVGPPVNLASFLCSKARAGTMLIDEASFLTTGAALPRGSRTLWTDSEKLHQRVATIEVNAGEEESAEVACSRLAVPG